VLSAVVFVLTVLVVGALVFLGGALLLGRGETRPPADPDRSPLELPADRPVTADDVRSATLSVTLRGYRMTEVDWLIEQLAQTIEERDEEIAALRRRPAAPGPDDVPPPAPADGARADA
jgi:DivIVA domain-containing protein